MCTLHNVWRPQRDQLYQSTFVPYNVRKMRGFGQILNILRFKDIKVWVWEWSHKTVSKDFLLYTIVKEINSLKPWKNCWMFLYLTCIIWWTGRTLLFPLSFKLDVPEIGPQAHPLKQQLACLGLRDCVSLVQRRLHKKVCLFHSRDHILGLFT